MHYYSHTWRGLPGQVLLYAQTALQQVLRLPQVALGVQDGGQVLHRLGHFEAVLAVNDLLTCVMCG